MIKNLGELDKENEYVIFMNSPEAVNFVAPGNNFRVVKVEVPHYSVAEQIKLPGKLWREKLDLIHFTHFNAPLAYRGRSVVTIHDLTLEKYPGKMRRGIISKVGYKLIMRDVVKKSEKIFTVSEYTKKDLREILGVREEKMTVTYNGVGEEFGPVEDEGARAGIRKRYGLDKPFLLYTGVWGTHKNLVRLVQVYKKLLEEGREVLLVMTGKGDGGEGEVSEEIRRLGLEKAVKWVGMVPEEDLRGLYSMAEMYVFPSLYEGFGLPPLEAMASGTAVVASNRSSIPEVCGEGNALYFDPENTEEVKKQIEKVLDDTDLREELIKKGKEWVKRYRWEETAKKTWEGYKEVLKA